MSVFINHFSAQACLFEKSLFKTMRHEEPSIGWARKESCNPRRLRPFHHLASVLTTMFTTRSSTNVTSNSKVCFS